MASVERKNAIVLGAGISGLAAARALIGRGIQPLVLESCPSIGGLTRTIRIGEFCFDYTGHLLHILRWATPVDVPFAGLNNDDWQRIDRHSCCYVGGKLITAPVQYHLGELPAEMLAEFIAAYDARPALPPKPSFRDFLVSGFGQALADAFLIPLNEKTMATSADRLTTDAARRFFPLPDEQKVRAGLEPDAPAPQEYNSQFWYPKQGGIERLVEGLAAGVQDIRLLSEVVEIDIREHTLRIRDGQQWQWERLYSSMPLPYLCRITNDAELIELSRGLTHSSTICLNLGLRGPLPPKLQGVHWIYVPDRNIPFYRVGFYSNITRGLCPADCSSIYVEVGVDGSTPIKKSAGAFSEFQSTIISALDLLGWVARDSIVCSAVHVMRCAYVHHTPSRQHAVPLILEKLKAEGIHAIGRYGLWDHMSMEDSMASGIAAIE